ncbi:hypothetical protein AJ79_01569 [Helicocarpus griseus UAMH5409]|uniref:Uncharacterized protein n=1 Tax=Helicocarpus griseus UAMH5409 TaxID=1447875 RepID=A0A2B7Y5E5_9EURO|nr:hypothetical protein AJ79_01569 [Helicocarpus griseus UAMH5409]
MSTRTLPHPSPSPLYSPFSSSSSAYPPPAKKQRKMSLTQTYYLAHTARAKLSREAARSDHDLRILVGHANMLDSLMLDLADAEREQEKWFTQSVRGASRDKHIQWAETVVEEPGEDWDPEDISSDSDSDSDSDSSDYDEDVLSPVLSRHQQPPATPKITTREIIRYADEEEAIEDDDEEDFDGLALTRTHSRSNHQPPELLDDEDDSSEDESMPPSPPQPTLDSFASSSESGKEVVAAADGIYTKRPETSGFAGLPSETDQPAFFEEGFFLPQRDRAEMIEAF